VTVRRPWSRKRKYLLVAVSLVAVGMAAAVALATPGAGVTTTTFVTADFNKTVHTNSDRVKFQTKDLTTVRVQKLDWAAGAYSGWHHHPGVIIVTVQSGSVTVMDSNCNTVTYGPGLPDGAVFVEGGDAPLQVTSDNGAVEYAMQVAPRANPPVFRIEDQPPACAS
jgi:quercetin dioxygenase-like cupin family protein